MEVEYSLTPKDIVALTQYHAARLPANPMRSSWATWVLASAMLIMGAGQLGASLWFGTGELLVIGLLTLGCGVWLTLGLRRPKGQSAFSVRRMLKQGDNARMLEPQGLQITEAGLTSTTALSSAFREWKGIREIAVTEDYALFYYAEKAAYIVPRSAFADEGEFTSLVDTAKRYRREAGRPQEGFREMP
jgi:hypothetical protein